MVCSRGVTIPTLLDNQNGIQPTQEKVAAIQNIYAYRNVKLLTQHVDQMI
jgi:hypothetical protein